MKIDIKFSGKESDQFVQFSLLFLEQGIQPDVIIIGREPITSTNIEIYGKVIDTTWQGYRRTITILTEDKTEYLIGGSNSTKPIASSEVIFQVNLETIGCSYLKNNDFNHCIEKIKNNNLSKNYIIALNVAIRIGLFKKNQQLEIAKVLIESLDSLDKTIQRQIVSTFSLIENEVVLKRLGDLLDNSDLSIRKEASLRLRGFDIVINTIGENSEVSNYVIDSLADRVNDYNEDIEVKIYSAENLGYYYNDKAIDTLFNALNSLHEHIRWSSSVALGRTNNISVSKRLIKFLENETSNIVQQGILLSLGRLSSNFKDDNALKKSLCLMLLDRGAEQIWAYVIYTLGELENITSECLSNLLNFLRQINDYQIQSNTILTLIKQLSNLYSDTIQVEQIIRELEQNLKPEKPQGWPESAYYKWYLIGAAELSSQLEKHYISWKYYEKSSTAFVSINWLATYYKGVGLYEKAEYECSRENISVAIEDIIVSLEFLNATKINPDFLEQTDKIGSGLEFKILLAEARKYVLLAYIKLEECGLSNDENLYDASAYLNQSLEKYNRIDIIGNASDSKKLSNSEKSLINGFKFFVQFGLHLIKLKEYSIQLDESKIKLLLGTIQALSVSISDLGMNTRSKSFKILADNINNLLSSINTTEIITKQVDIFIKNAIKLFAKPFPTPGTCPIYQFGHAELQINLLDALFGKGTKNEPFVIHNDTQLIFDGTVLVNDRTKNDELLVVYQKTFKNAEELDNQKIPVHENMYKLRPINYGIQNISKVAIPYKFILEFKNQSCKQIVEDKDIWVKVVDIKSFLNKKEHKKELDNKINELKEQKSTLKDKISKIESGSKISLSDKVTLKEYKTLLNDTKNEIKKIKGIL